MSGGVESVGERQEASRTHVHPEIEPLAAEWDALADQVAAPPFLRPGWFAIWWRAFGSGTLDLLVVRRAGRLSGVLPLERRRGVVRGLANYHSPLFEPLVAHPDDARTLYALAAARTSRRLSLGFLDGSGPMPREVSEAASAAGFRVLQRSLQRTPELAIDGDWADYRGRLDRRFRKELGRLRRRLYELGSVELEITDGSADLERLLQEVLTVEASGWKGEAGTAIASRPETRSFYEELSRWASARGLLRVLILRLDGKPVAVDLALEASGVRYMLKGGFEAEYSRAAPGILLLEAGLEHAFESGLRRVELGGGDDAYKLRWTTAVRERHLVQAFPPRPLGWADWLAFAVARPVAARARQWRLRQRERARHRSGPRT